MPSEDEAFLRGYGRKQPWRDFLRQRKLQLSFQFSGMTARLSIGGAFSSNLRSCVLFSLQASKDIAKMIRISLIHINNDFIFSTIKKSEHSNPTFKGEKIDGQLHGGCLPVKSFFTFCVRPRKTFKN